MYLKRIELQGFKSFVDRVSIEINSQITAVVGPNGSGKSNISDAVRWVMGEQSAKSLRGSKMEDVIFSGTASRKPLSFAEVTLTLDNSLGFLQSDYGEVEVTRRVYRSGEGEYFINKKPCRLKDLHELFMDTGMGKDGYSIVGQGRIDEILSARSEDRRQVFEEAAGIAKYRYRKNEAERKLERAEENLSRVRDILGEVSERLDPLEKQSGKAKTFLSLRDSLRGIEISALLDVIDAKKTAIEEIRRQQKIASDNFEGAKAELEKHDQRTEALFGLIKETDAEVEALRSALFALDAKAAEAASRRAVTENTVENLRAAAASAGDELSGLDKKIAAAKEPLREDSVKTALETDLKNLEKALDEILTEAGQRGDAVARANAELEAAREKAAAVEQRKRDARGKISSMALMLPNADERVAAIEGEIGAALNHEQALEGDIQEINRVEAEQKAKQEKTGDLIFQAEQKAARAAAQSERLKSEYNAMTARVSELTGRVGTLEDMERALEGYGRGVRELMNAKKNGRYGGSLIGVLSKLITVLPENIAAVEAALGAAMQNIVVKKEEDAKDAIEFLKKNDLGRVTFLPLCAQEGRRLEGEKTLLGKKGAVAVAADLVTREKQLDRAIEALLGRVVVCDNLDNAIALARESKYQIKIVTLGGELLQIGGSISGGSVNKSQALLGRVEEIARIKKDCARIEKEAQKKENEIEKALLEAKGARAEAASLKEGFASSESNLLKCRADRELKENLLKAAKERREKLADERERLFKQLGDADALKDALEREIAQAEAEAARAREDIESRQAQFLAAMASKEALSDQIMGKKVEINAKLKDIEVERARRLDAERRIEELKAERDAKLKAQLSAEEKIAALAESLRESHDARGADKEQSEALKAKIALRLEGRAGTDAELAALREKMRAMNETILTLQSECVKVENRLNKAQYDLENASSRLWEDYELTYNLALEHRCDIGPLPKAQKEIARLKNEIKALGDIHIGAIEEYKEVRQRHDFLSAQLADAQEAKEALQKLIREMMTVMRIQFAQRFDVINEHFAQAFSDLFGGGKAEVRLSDPLDVLESGIEIEVQPPGKKLQSITLLSGGEKALTAIALLFAFLKVSPSPVLVLDEIETALDDENVYRFAEYVKNNSSDTQFIIITHRRGTMEVSDMLYGVTMQERGVSRLLAMKFDAHSQLA